MLKVRSGLSAHVPRDGGVIWESTILSSSTGWSSTPAYIPVPQLRWPSCPSGSKPHPQRELRAAALSPVPLASSDELNLSSSGKREPGKSGAALAGVGSTGGRRSPGHVSQLASAAGRSGSCVEAAGSPGGAGGRQPLPKT